MYCIYFLVLLLTILIADRTAGLTCRLTAALTFTAAGMLGTVVSLRINSLDIHITTSVITPIFYYISPYKAITLR